MTSSNRADAPWTIRRVLQWTREEFERRELDSPRLDSELLLGHVLGLTRMKLYLDLDRPLSPAELSAFKALVKRRAAREPVSQLLGYREFWHHSFKVSRHVLTPRPETEHLVEDVLAFLANVPAPAKVLDVGTGTGCIAICVALGLPGCQVTAVDISKDALALAKENVEALQAPVTLLLSDMDKALPADAAFHVVVSNPPYLTPSEWTEADPEVRDHEPRIALVGEGDDGLGHHRMLAKKLWPRVLAGGGLWAEMGWKQGPAAVELWRAATGLEPVILKDLDGRDRIIKVLKPS